MKIKVRGDGVYLTRDSAVRDVPHRRISKIRPFKDRAREGDAGYIFSLPAADGGRRYFARDANENSRMMRLFIGRGEEDEQAEEIPPELPPGDYHAVSAYDGVHIYRDEGEEQQPVANNGSEPISNMPGALAQLNTRTADFWRKQLAGDSPHGPVLAGEIAKAVAAVMHDGGITDRSSMLHQRGLAALNAQHRTHYGSGRAHDAGGSPKCPPTSAAQINQRNRQRWSSTGRQ